MTEDLYIEYRDLHIFLTGCVTGMEGHIYNCLPRLVRSLAVCKLQSKLPYIVEIIWIFFFLVILLSNGVVFWSPAELVTMFSVVLKISIYLSVYNFCIKNLLF